jgi:hypothetical protein
MSDSQTTPTASAASSCAENILKFLGNGREGKSKEAILDSVSGRRQSKLAAFKDLQATGTIIVVAGQGSRGSPFLYAAANAREALPTSTPEDDAPVLQGPLKDAFEPTEDEFSLLVEVFGLLAEMHDANASGTAGDWNSEPLENSPKAG